MLWITILTVLLPWFCRCIFNWSGGVRDLQPHEMVLGLYGSPNNFTVPILQKLNGYNLSCYVTVTTTSLSRYPYPLISYLNKSQQYKFVPYLNKSVSVSEEFNAISMLMKKLKLPVSVVASNTFVPFQTVLRPSYFLPTKNNRSILSIDVSVWTDYYEGVVHGLVMIPYSKRSLEYLDEFIRDSFRFNITIKNIQNI